MFKFKYINRCLNLDLHCWYVARLPLNPDCQSASESRLTQIAPNSRLTRLGLFPDWPDCINFPIGQIGPISRLPDSPQCPD